jgi:HNH endonuclease
MNPGALVSYIEMCQAEGASLQRGMNFRLHDEYSVILMSRRSGAPYADRVEQDGKILIYEGHDAARTRATPNPKLIDQPRVYPSGTLTENGLFYEAADRYKQANNNPELVRVYEKIRSGIWVYNGIFRLLDGWKERAGCRLVFKFRLELTEQSTAALASAELEHSRLIPSEIKLEVWKRDGGKCTVCGSTDNLHFDHVIPYSKGGSSLVAKNIQLLCARHNLSKHDRIE